MQHRTSDVDICAIDQVKFPVNGKSQDINDGNINNGNFNDNKGNFFPNYISVFFTFLLLIF